MYALATTRITVIRGTETDDYGDEVDKPDPVQRGVLASLMESTRRVFDPVSGSPRIIKFYKCRVPNGTDIRIDDRIKDESDNSLYAIDNISPLTGPSRLTDLRLDLSKVN